MKNNRHHEKDYLLARQLAEHAQLNANPAEAVARAAKTQQPTDEVREHNRMLRHEIDRNSK